MHEQIAYLRRAENNRKDRKEISRKQSNVTANPFLFTKNLLGDKKLGRLDCPRQEIEDTYEM
ncbi:hypothetical protein DPMN_105887 [Dreissena polymorpha]|uniref:Uncharacterized protein n=1 Tax=Dreissena polymorpha TaxID=45954 RepID=A0A9D4K406_DREPO|nr:hypothetical protein DPMN_105887 [Dreissena polymorpha]